MKLKSFKNGLIGSVMKDKIMYMNRTVFQIYALKITWFIHL